MQPGETVVVDIGAEYNYYSADITRTFPVSGKFTLRQRQLYQLVLNTQRACEKYVQPGKTTLHELNQFAREFMRKSPLRARTVEGEEQTMDAFFAHGLGHWLGMDVHDVGGGSDVLVPGVVFTIEPGLYIPSEGTGIRIEDDYLVTEKGLEKLSSALPADPDRIEAMMRAQRR
jgi:Xaa-Pro aminopeptidase